MTYFLIFSCVLGAWAMLRLMGSERTEMMKELETRMRREEKQKPASPPVLAPAPTATTGASAPAAKAAPPKAPANATQSPSKPKH